MLRRGLREECQGDLQIRLVLNARCAKIAMVAGANHEDAQHIQHHGECHGAPGHAGPGGGEARDVNQQETRCWGQAMSSLCLRVPARMVQSLEA